MNGYTRKYHSIGRIVNPNVMGNSSNSPKSLGVLVSWQKKTLNFNIYFFKIGEKKVMLRVLKTKGHAGMLVFY